MSQPPKEYPYERQWSVTSVDIGRYITLQNNWNKSKKLINKIRDCLRQAELHSRVETVAAAGSIGRMEASPDVSDADLIIVLSNETDLKSQEAEEAYESVWRALKECLPNLEEPYSKGVFAKPTNQDQLLGSEIGEKTEEVHVFSKRLLLLLETQPVYENENYTKLINAVVERYAKKYVEYDSTKEWTFLLNDLIRYFRSLCVNYQWGFENEAGKWPLRNIKLRHSRLIMYGGLLMLLGEASKERENKVSWLQEKLKMTPLERLAWVYEQNQDWNFHRIAGLYHVFLSQLNDSEVREKLNVDPVGEAGDEENQGEELYKQRYASPEFASLKANSDGLIAELLRFILERRGKWTERFFEYLIF